MRWKQKSKQESAIIAIRKHNEMCNKSTIGFSNCTPERDGSDGQPLTKKEPGFGVIKMAGTQLI